MKKYLMSLLAACSFIFAIADALPIIPQQPTLSIQIIKEQLNFTKQSFNSVKIVENANGKPLIQVELTPAAAKQMHDLTADNLNHTANIVWHRFILSMVTIQSALGDKFQITGFNQQQADLFVKEMQP